MGKFSAHACKKRWGAIKSTYPPPAWTGDEDEHLKELYEQYPEEWDIISIAIDGRSAQQCQQRWESFDSEWTAEEDDQLRELYEEYSSRWDLISSEMDGRSAEQCLTRWSSFLQQQSDIACTAETDEPTLLPHRSDSASTADDDDETTPMQRWTSQEDEQLRQLSQQYPQQWDIISCAIVGRTPEQCRSRWVRVFRDVWTEAEDTQLKQYHKHFGKRWVQIAEALNCGKSAVQCRNRWTLYVNTMALRAARWTEADDQKLLSLRNNDGNSWLSIAVEMGRSVKLCRERWKRLTALILR